MSDVCCLESQRSNYVSFPTLMATVTYKILLNEPTAVTKSD